MRGKVSAHPVDLRRRKGCKVLNLLAELCEKLEGAPIRSIPLIGFHSFDSFLCFRKYGGIPEAFASLRAEQREVPP